VKASPESPNFHVVANHDGDRSIWPDYRRAELPPGWRTAGFSGSREACLQHIAREKRPPAAHASVRTGPERAASRATAVPFGRPDAGVRLFVFPHAGSGASYYHFLARALKDDPIEVHIVQYPGREMRVKEPALTSMAAMLESLGADLCPRLAEKPCALFGHSMGALIAFEFARRLRAAGEPAPQHLFLSGRQAPQVPGPVLQVERLDDEAFLDAVGRRYHALPPEVLAHREILELVLPSLRADFTLMERYAYQPAPPLAVPITLLNGAADPWVSADSLAAWRTQSTYPLQSHTLPGGHFYLPGAAQQIRALLLPMLGRPAKSGGA